MDKGRVEAFSDGVIAIIITIMVLQLRVPHSVDIDAMLPVVPVFLSYVLSFVMIGTYWNNHHHMFHAVHQVRGGVLWANLHFLFWLSLMPFTTAWMGENHIEAVPVALYGFVLLMCGIAYFILARTLIVLEGRGSALAIAFGPDRKGRISVLIYASAIGLAFLSPWIAIACYVAVALIWLVPDRRVEQVLLSVREPADTAEPGGPPG
jgi:uncharacterized membrane protein